MSRFLMDRGIFDNNLWQDPVTFRLFFYLVGKAAFKDGVKSGGHILSRGQYLRSYRKIQEDLTYIENRAVKTLSLSTIKRSVEKLVKQDRIKIEESDLGTLFTVVNYQQYQEFPESSSKELGTALEQRWNADGTTAEHQANNKNECYEGIKQEEVEKAPQKSPQGKRLPDDWYPDAELTAWAIEARADLLIPEEIEKFRDHFHSATGPNSRKLNWDKAFKNWIRGARQRFTPQQQKTQIQHHSQRIAGRITDF